MSEKEGDEPRLSYYDIMRGWMRGGVKIEIENEKVLACQVQGRITS